VLPPQLSEEVRLVWEYVRAVAKYWWLVIVALGLTWLDLVERIFGTWYTPPLWAKIAAGVAGLTFAQFLAYRDLRKSERAELSRLNQRNAELTSQVDLLQVRPYGHAHEELAQRKIDSLGPSERDLLRYLLHFGETEQERLSAASAMGTAFAETLDKVARTQLINKIERSKLGRAGIDSFWQVRPEFVEVLRDLLFPRQEQVHQTFFSG
jgi:hypothetical protein